MAPLGLEFRYHVVDVFTDEALAGNALCVVVDPVPEAAMQAIAREVNLSETTFPVVTGDAEYDVRIFTPHQEMPFAGHPSLGTAWLLGAKRWTQRTDGATVVLDADEQGAVMTQPDPTVTTVEVTGLAKAFGLRDDSAGKGAFVAEAGGLRHLIVATEQAIDRLDPDGTALRDATRSFRCHTAAVVCPVDDTILHVRVFAPGLGIGEDPATGSAAGPIGLLARDLWQTAADVVIRQGAEMGRPSLIEVHAEEGDIRVGGRVSACAHGVFTL